MAKFSLSVLLCFLAFWSWSQTTPIVELSATFSAPNCYKSRVIQCTNGNTFLFNYKKAGGEFLLFDKDRKMVKRSGLTGRLAGAGESNDSYIQQVFETDTALAFFLSQKIGGKVTLFRVLLSTTNGAIINEQKIVELSKPKQGSGWAYMFGGVYAGVRIARDRSSGSYAVISYDGFTEDTAARLHIDLYNVKHQLLWGHTYSKLPPDHKYLDLSDIIVKESKVYLCTHEFTTRSYGTEESILVLSEIGASGEMIRQQKLDIDPGLKGSEIKLLHTPAVQKIMLCVLKPNGTFKGGFNRFNSYVASIKEADFSVSYNKEVNLDLMDEYSRNACPKRKDFAGCVCDWFVDEQGNVSLLMAEVATQTSTTYHTNSMLSGTTSSATELADIGVLQINNEGVPARAYVVVQEQASLKMIEPRLMNGGELNGVEFDTRPKFLYEDVGSPDLTGCDFIHTNEQDYLICNVHREVYDGPLCDGSIMSVGGIDRTYGTLYTITNGTQKRDYLWGMPKDKKNFKCTAMGSTHYLEKTKTYAAVMIEQQERTFVARVGWIHL